MQASGSRLLAVAALLGAAALFAVYRYDPAEVSFFPPCVFRALTGFLCPGCGATRALHHLLHGDVAGAFRLNAMLLFLGPVLTVTTLVELRAVASGSAAPRLVNQPWFAWTVVVLIVGWGVLRNVFGM